MCVVRSNLLTRFDSCVAEMTAALPYTSGLDVAQASIAEHKERAIRTAMKVHAVLMEHISGSPSVRNGRPKSRREKHAAEFFHSLVRLSFRYAVQCFRDRKLARLRRSLRNTVPVVREVAIALANALRIRACVNAAALYQA